MPQTKKDFVRFCKRCGNLFKTNHRYSAICFKCQVKQIKKNKKLGKSRKKVYLKRAVAYIKFIKLE